MIIITVNALCNYSLIFYSSEEKTKQMNKQKAKNIKLIL